MSNDIETTIAYKEQVLKFRNDSNSRYIKIPDKQFPEIKHDDFAEIRRKETIDKIYLIYVFNK